jgi:hypothetical protein
MITILSNPASWPVFALAACKVFRAVDKYRAGR